VQWIEDKVNKIKELTQESLIMLGNGTLIQKDVQVIQVIMILPY
jgi:hypothetical protein